MVVEFLPSHGFIFMGGIDMTLQELRKMNKRDLVLWFYNCKSSELMEVLQTTDVDVLKHNKKELMDIVLYILDK